MVHYVCGFPPKTHNLSLMGKKISQITNEGHPPKISDCYPSNLSGISDVSLLMLTSVTWLRPYLPGFPTVKSVSPTAELWKEVAMHCGHFCVMLHLLNSEDLRRLFRILLHESFLSPLTFIYSVIYLYRYGLESV